MLDLGELEPVELVGVGDGRQDRLEVAPADKLHLAASDQFAKWVEKFRMVFLKPLEQDA